MDSPIPAPASDTMVERREEQMLPASSEPTREPELVEDDDG